MPDSNLTLRCDSENRRYTLTMGGDSAVYSFPTTSDAMEFAGTLVKKETKLTVYDATGMVLIVTTVLPTTG